MKPAKTMPASKSGKKSSKLSGKENVDGDIAARRAMFPALAIPNDPSIRVFAFDVCVHAYWSSF
jgi:hypothetical protein